MVKKSATTQQESGFAVPVMNIAVCDFTIIGHSPLICHAWSKKAIEEMLGKQLGAVKTSKHAPKEPVQDFVDSMYIWPDTEAVLHDESEGFDYKAHLVGRFGFPAIAFKAAAVRAATDSGLKMTDMRRAFHIDSELVEITGSDPVLRRDMVRVGQGVADIRYRGMFEQWKAVIRCNINTAVFKEPTQIWHLFRSAGFGVGVGEWRPERNGLYGRFTIDPQISMVRSDSDVPTVVTPKQ